MATNRTVQPAFEPVTLAEAKLHLRVDHSEEDALITAIISSAREEADHLTGRSICLSTWKLTLDTFPDVIELMTPPIASVTSVKYYDADGVQQTLSSAAYTVDMESHPGRIVPAYGYSWPTIQDRINAVEVIYTAGWANADAVPPAIVSWILVKIGTLYANREMVVTGTAAMANEIPFINSLLNPWIVWGKNASGQA